MLRRDLRLLRGRRRRDLFLPLGGGGHRLRLTNLGLVSFQLGPIPPHIDFDQLSWALVVPPNY